MRASNFCISFQSLRTSSQIYIRNKSLVEHLEIDEIWKKNLSAKRYYAKEILAIC